MPLHPLTSSALRFDGLRLYATPIVQIIKIKFTLESTLKTEELHKIEYVGYDRPMRSNIDTALPPYQFWKGTTANEQ